MSENIKVKVEAKPTKPASIRQKTLLSLANRHIKDIFSVVAQWELSEKKQLLPKKPFDIALDEDILAKDHWSCGGLCAPASLANLFSSVIIPFNQAQRLSSQSTIRTENGDIINIGGLTDIFEYIAEARHVHFDNPRTSSDFISQMQEPTSYGALIHMEDNKNQGHLVSLRTVPIATDEDPTGNQIICVDTNYTHNSKWQYIIDARDHELLAQLYSESVFYEDDLSRGIWTLHTQ